MLPADQPCCDARPTLPDAWRITCWHAVTSPAHHSAAAPPQLHGACTKGPFILMSPELPACLPARLPAPRPAAAPPRPWCSWSALLMAPTSPPHRYVGHSCMPFLSYVSAASPPATLCSLCSPLHSRNSMPVPRAPQPVVLTQCYAGRWPDHRHPQRLNRLQHVGRWALASPLFPLSHCLLFESPALRPPCPPVHPVAPQLRCGALTTPRGSSSGCLLLPRCLQVGPWWPPVCPAPCWSPWHRTASASGRWWSRSSR